MSFFDKIKDVTYMSTVTILNNSSISNEMFVASINTRSSADADNRLDAFSGQSRLTNMVPFHMYSIVCIVSLCNSNFVFKTF